VLLVSDWEHYARREAPYYRPIESDRRLSTYTHQLHRRDTNLTWGTGGKGRDRVQGFRSTL
jgi:hypothetical protein